MKITSGSLRQTINDPLLESFKLEGVNGYKNIGINLEKNIKIVAAENGTGKTTLLNALYGLLAGKPGFLLSIDFTKLTVKFSGHSPISATKDELFPTPTKSWLKKTQKLPAWREAFSYGLSDIEFLKTVLFNSTGGDDDFENSIGYRKLYDDTPFDRDDIKNLCDRAITEILAEGQFSAIHQKIKEAMNGVSVLYLPTFRRIEADLPEYRRRTGISRTRRSRDDWDSDRLIYFGLHDVDRRLKTITADIKKNTLDSYSKISARTLEQLLEGDSSGPEKHFNESDIATLKVVLARLGKTESDTETRLINLIKNGEINESHNQSLRSFLAQLLEIYQEKRDHEQAVESFAQVIASYFNYEGTEKKFQFDKLTVEAKAVNIYTEDDLKLGTLSSGEKQIVSIFARLYLDAKKKYLILIDEPELSLSMEWQQKFLPDVLKAPSCIQLLAITHSPFIFNNALDPYAGSLEISYYKKSNEQQ
jgi:ABC-type transport system involved in cytochrome c biogenesis ATPase subunit